MNSLQSIIDEFSRSTSKHQIELTFESRDTADKWREWLESSGLKPFSSDSESNFDAESRYGSDSEFQDLSSSELASEEDMAYADHMKSPVEQVKKLVDSYVVLMKKKFKDQIPKMCTKEMIDSTNKFISIELRIKVRESMQSVDALIEGDPEEELKRDLTEKSKLYSEAIDIIDKYTKI